VVKEKDSHQENIIRSIH